MPGTSSGSGTGRSLFPKCASCRPGPCGAGFCALVLLGEARAAAWRGCWEGVATGAAAACAATLCWLRPGGEPALPPASLLTTSPELLSRAVWSAEQAMHLRDAGSPGAFPCSPCPSRAARHLRLADGRGPCACPRRAVPPSWHDATWSAPNKTGRSAGVRNTRLPIAARDIYYMGLLSRRSRTFLEHRGYMDIQVSVGFGTGSIANPLQLQRVCTALSPPGPWQICWVHYKATRA